MEFEKLVIQISNPGAPFVMKGDYLDKLKKQLPKSFEGE
jgi:hypothetical protein